MSASNWESHYSKGTIGARPAANTLPKGAIYFATDEDKYYVGAGSANTWADFAGPFTTATTVVEQAQDAVGAMVDASLTYVDATPLLQRAALTGDVTASAGSNATTIANDAVSYAKMQNVSAASKLIGRGSASGSGDPEEIALGSGLTMTGTTLSSSGGGGGSGALVFLERHVASNSASLDFTTFISGTYDKYLIIGEGINLQNNATDLLLEVGTGGTPTYDTGGSNTYEWARIGITTSGSGANDNGTTGAAKLFNSMSNAAAYGVGHFSLTATMLQSTSYRKTFYGTTHYVASSGPVSVVGTTVIQWTTSGTAATALRFIPSSGNILVGSITIYGYTNS